MNQLCVRLPAAALAVAIGAAFAALPAAGRGADKEKCFGVVLDLQAKD